MANKSIDFDGISTLCFMTEFAFSDYLHDVTASGNVNQIVALRVLLRTFRNATKKIYKELKNYEKEN